LVPENQNLNIEQILNIGKKESQSNQIIQNSEEENMNFVMSYKTANDLIYRPELKTNSCMIIAEENEGSEMPISVKKEVMEPVKLTPGAESAGLPTQKKSFNLS
tara:strand:+ start:549 stop:860 length:312 start_codon:yes stop_codon:yes gene_type:complete